MLASTALLCSSVIINPTSSTSAKSVVNLRNLGSVLNVASSPSGTTIVMWHAGGTSNGDPDIWFTRSTDGLTGWSTDAYLQSAMATDVANSYSTSPSLATDGKGNWIALVHYLQFHAASTVFDGIPNSLHGCECRLLSFSSTDDGVTWGNPACVPEQGRTGYSFSNTPGTHEEKIHYCKDRWVAIYQLRGFTKRLWCYATSTDLGATWGSHFCYDKDNAHGGYDFTTDAFYGPYFQCTENAWLTIWSKETSNSDTDLYFSRSVDSGSTWSAAALLIGDTTTREAYNGAGVSIAADGKGKVLVAFASEDGTNSAAIKLKCVSSTDDGKTWGSPVAVASATSQTNPQLSHDGAGLYVVAYQEKGSAYKFKSAASSDLGATWSTPSVIEDATPATTSFECFPLYVKNKWVFVYQLSYSDVTSSVGKTALDCAGVAGGSATVKACGCNDADSCKDCKGVANGNTKKDLCEVCGGDSSTCTTETVTIEFSTLFSSFVRAKFDAILTASGTNQVTLTKITLTASKYGPDEKLKVTIVSSKDSGSIEKVKNLVTAEAFKSDFGTAAVLVPPKHDAASTRSVFVLILAGITTALFAV